MEAIKVNLIPSGISEACHASQYDVGRQIRLDLFDGLNPYTIKSGDTFTLNVRKPDNHVITQTVTGTEGNTYLVIETSEQMTAVTGENLCEIRIENDGDNIGSLNFVMQVEKDVIANGIPSESVIEDLEALVVEAVGDNYYTKTETDELLDTKADVTDLLDLLPTDNASGAVANFTDGADDVPVKALSVEFAATQASGTPTPSSPIPITPVNSIAVTRTGKNLISHTSFGTFSDWKGDLVPFGDTPTSNANRGFALPTKAGKTYTISFGISDESFPIYLYLCKSNRVDTSSRVAYITTNTKVMNRTYTFTADGDLYYLRMNTYDEATFNTQVSKCSYEQLELGQAATDYEAYNGTTALINLGGTYYGGEVDCVTGKITLDHGINTFDGSENWTATDTHIFRLVTTGRNWLPVNAANWALGYLSNILRTDVRATGATSDKLPDHSFYITSQYLYVRCDEYDLAGFTTALGATNLEIVAPVATPATAQASNTIELNTLLGDNNFFSDAGDVDVTIRADIALYIQKMLGGNVNRSLGANPSILRTGAISTDIEVREPVEPDSEPVELEREITEQPENEGNDNEER